MKAHIYTILVILAIIFLPYIVGYTTCDWEWTKDSMFRKECPVFMGNYLIGLGYLASIAVVIAIYLGIYYSFKDKY